MQALVNLASQLGRAELYLVFQFAAARLDAPHPQAVGPANDPCQRQDDVDTVVEQPLPRGDDAEKDLMIASIGPFWDANETWLVLGIGILLVAFPMAHGVILTALYLPIAVMLLGLILRGVAFDFRVKARAEHKERWNTAFFAGSLITALAQGFMLGRLVTGFEITLATTAFAAFIGLCLASGYALLGATWLIIKTEGALQLKAVAWARRAIVLTALGIGAVSIMTPALNERIFDKWFTLENLIMVWPIPAMTLVVLAVAWRSLRRLPVRLADEAGHHHSVAARLAGTDRVEGAEDHHR